MDDFSSEEVELTSEEESEHSSGSSDESILRYRLASNDSNSDGGGSAAEKLEAADTDTSDEEEIRNTIGNIPLEWYDDLQHIGYDIDGEKITKSLDKGDEVDFYNCG